MIIITTHRDLINAVTQIVTEVCAKKGDAFSRGVCFGYVSCWLEAFLSQKTGQFYEALQLSSELNPEARQRFFYGMALHQSPETFLEDQNHYHQDYYKTLPLVMGQALKDKGGPVQVLSLTGFYNAVELSGILKAILRVTQRLGLPTAWTFSGGKHSCALSFHPDKIQLVDANHPAAPLVFNCEVQQQCENLARILVNLFTLENTIETAMKNHRIITFEWVCAKQDSALFQSHCQAITQDPLVLEANTITLTKIMHPDPNNHWWLDKAVYANDLPLVKALLDNHCSCNRLILHDAILYGYVEMSKYLMQRGWDLNKQDAWGKTPLHHAILFGQVEICKSLLESGANTQLETSNGMNALVYAQKLAAEENRPERKQEYEIMIQWLQEGPRPRPLHFAWSGAPGRLLQQSPPHNQIILYSPSRV